MSKETREKIRKDAMAHRKAMLNTPAADLRDERTANHCKSLDFIYLLIAENELLESQLAAYKDAEKFVADPPHDQECCGCVAILREQLAAYRWIEPQTILARRICDSCTNKPERLKGAELKNRYECPSFKGNGMPFQKCLAFEGSQSIGRPDYVKKHEALLEQFRWIPVSERLPEESFCDSELPILVGIFSAIEPKSQIGVMWLMGGENWKECIKVMGYTHWMPIPPLPEKGTKTDFDVIPFQPTRRSTKAFSVADYKLDDMPQEDKTDG